MTSTSDMSGLEEFSSDEFNLPDEITTGEDLFQTSIREYGTEREYAYKLTAFVPSASTPASGTGYPAEAAYWIIPDLNNCSINTVVKIFKLSFVDKVPAPFNTLFLRVDRQNNPNPTEFQEAVWKSAVSNFQRQDGRAQTAQIYLVPVIRRYKGEWDTSIGELSPTALMEIKKANAIADDNSDGRANIGTRPIAIWKPGSKQVTAWIDNRADVDVPSMIKQYESEMIDVKDYVKTRAVATEQYLLKQWRVAKNEAAPGDPDEMDPNARFADATMSLKLPQLQTILKEAGISTNGAKSKPALIEIVLANQEATEAAVLAASAIE